MKKFIAVLCILLLLTSTVYASPATDNTLRCTTGLVFRWAIESENWPLILDRLKTVTDLTEGYTLLDALEVTLDKVYTTVSVPLSKEVTEKQEPFVLIINNFIITQQKLEVIDDQVIVDFTGYNPGTYYLCFYVK